MGWLDDAWSGLSNLFSGGGTSGGIGTSDILRDTASVDNTFGSGADYSWSPPSTSDVASGMNWSSGFTDLGKNIAAGAAGPIAGGLVGLGVNALMPGQPQKVNLVDTRQGVTQQGANMALDRARNIQQNPTSFGLPGDPNDPNTPAGRKMYNIIQTSRAADAARGGFTSGGSAQRETNAVNEAIGNEYNKAWDSSMQTLAGQPAMAGYVTPKQENPWAKLIAGAVNPAVSKGVSSLLSDWGMSA